MKQESHSPIVLNRMGNVLVATVQTDLTSSVLERFHEDLLNRLALERSPALLLDLSGVSVMDVEEFDALRKLARSATIMGAETWFVGFRPEVVYTLVGVGADTVGVKAALDLDDALTQIQRGQKGATHE
jgi:rsbT antagonist protein RsbS